MGALYVGVKAQEFFCPPEDKLQLFLSYSYFVTLGLILVS